MVTSSGGWARSALVFGTLLSVGVVFGCGKLQEKSTPEEGVAPAPPVAENKDATVTTAKVQVDPGLTKSFADATRQDPPGNWEPIDTTLTGKSVGKLYTEVKALWDSTLLVADNGKRLAHKATLETDEGRIEITLRPDWAPNHVRNFLALCKAGYYDGLVFELIHREASEDQPDVRFESIEAGCPKGTGATGSGSIGYWLKSEFNKDVKHEEGIVGAIHEIEADTAACRFYITLGITPSAAARLDGNFTVFGKVTQGLDVARKILTQPAKQSEETAGDIYFRPQKLVVIQKVTIHTTEVDEPLKTADNR